MASLLSFDERKELFNVADGMPMGKFYINAMAPLRRPSAYEPSHLVSLPDACKTSLRFFRSRGIYVAC